MQTRSDDERLCPYCGVGYQPESADYSDDVRIVSCDGCGKDYLAWDQFTVTFFAQPIASAAAAPDADKGE
jgi:hypothetical protein